jgi:hypothetical protein
MAKRGYARENGLVVGVVALCLAVLTWAVPSIGRAEGPAPEARNMALLGASDLQGRSAYQPTIHFQNGRWIAYVGHHGGTEKIPAPFNPLTGKNETNGTSIVDVTDVKHPVYLHHIPGEADLDYLGGAQMTRVCDGKTLPKGDPAKTYLLGNFGNSAQELYDVSDPSNPALIWRAAGFKKTHKNFSECDTGIAYLVTTPDGWRGRGASIYDFGDPLHPKFIRNFSLVGAQPGASGPEPPPLHGPISTGVLGNRVYFAYGSGERGILQIVDRKKLLEGPADPTVENLLAPQIARLDLPPAQGAHTAFPLIGVKVAEFARDKGNPVHNYIVLTGEEQEFSCLQPRQYTMVVDITNETTPMGISSWYVPEKIGNFCARGGRFGAHSSNENMTPLYYKKLMFFSYFNAGVRVVDVRDPYHFTEVASYIPATTAMTAERCSAIDGKQSRKIAVQTNNVEVDDRGYIYTADRANTGLHILALTGAARAIADGPAKQ